MRQPVQSAQSSSWEPHPQLVSDTLVLGDLPLSRVLLMRDATYPWLLLVPRRPDLVEISDLDAPAQAQLMTEITAVGETLKSVTHCDKLNIAALGNVVAQLHVHVIARFRGDPAWPKPVWGLLPAGPYDPAECDRFVGALRRALDLDPVADVERQ